jgi:hypothetical protein
MSNSVTNINFWNGNKSAARQCFETELLQAVLTATEKDDGLCTLNIDNTDYPNAQDEGNIFTNDTDILVTVAGNLKFIDKAKIMIEKPLTKGLLGYRLLLVCDNNLPKFASLQTTKELQSLSIGIPDTWVDAELFRENQYNVVEKGVFDELFTLLKSAEFDYCALGANEIEKEFEERAEPIAGISIEPSKMLYYPFPLVFYVNPNNIVLAKRVDLGLTTIFENGIYEQIFQKHYGDIVTRLNLKQRKVFTLENAILPEKMKNFRSTLLD